jgi:NarL family two-component system response regulator LiaR
MIVDDHAVVRIGLREILSSEPDIDVVGEAADGISAVTQAQTLRPDVLVLDLVMPGLHGIQVIEQLRVAAPQVRILVLTMFSTDERIFPSLQAGAHGFLLKESAPAELIQGIRDVVAGKSPLHPAVARRIRERYSQPPAPTSEKLTARETDVLALVAQGLSDKAIASRLALSNRSVRSHVSRILEKLHLTSRTQATLYALRTGLVRLEGGEGR